MTDTYNLAEKTKWNLFNVIEAQERPLEFYLSGPALDCIAYDFLQELSGS